MNSSSSNCLLLYFGGSTYTLSYSCTGVHSGRSFLNPLKVLGKSVVCKHEHFKCPAVNWNNFLIHEKKINCGDRVPRLRPEHKLDMSICLVACFDDKPLNLIITKKYTVKIV